MRKVSALGLIRIPPHKLWDLITDLEKYPRYVKFVKSVYPITRLKKGSEFTDVTKIVWVPITINHTVDIYEKNKKLGFFVKMPLGGEMYQRVVLMPEKEGTQVEMWIEFTHGNAIFDFFAGPILSKRLKEMLEFILEKGKKDFESNT